MQPKTVHETFISPTGTDIAMRNGWPFQKMKHDAEVMSSRAKKKKTTCKCWYLPVKLTHRLFGENWPVP
jgi:hypothetical protein